MSANESLALTDLKLQAGQVSETVTVLSQGTLVETQSSDLTARLTSDQISLISTKGRDITSLLLCYPAPRTSMTLVVFSFEVIDHDGFAMYPSAVSRYNIRDATVFKRDPMRELAAAARKHGLRFGLYYSHAFRVCSSRFVSAALSRQFGWRHS